MSKFSFPKKETPQPAVEARIDPSAVEAFAAAVRDRRDSKPWDKHDRKAPPRYNVSVRLNDYHLEMLRYLAKTQDISQQKILRRQLVSAIEALAEETHARESENAPSQ